MECSPERQKLQFELLMHVSVYSCTVRMCMYIHVHIIYRYIHVHVHAYNIYIVHNIYMYMHACAQSSHTLFKTCA